MTDEYFARQKERNRKEFSSSRNPGRLCVLPPDMADFFKAQAEVSLSFIRAVVQMHENTEVQS